MKTKLFLLGLLVIFFVFSCKRSNKVLNTVIVDKNIYENITWTKDKTYLVDNYIEVQNNATLTIEAGTTVKFTKDGEIDVGSDSYGTIIAKGTADEPIIFTSNSDVPNKGDWYGIWLYSGANNCEFEYCTFEYGAGYSKTSGVLNLRETKALIRNCTFQHNNAYAVYAYESGFDGFTSNTFNDNSGNPLYINGNFVYEIGSGNTYDGGVIEVEGDDINAATTVVWKNQGIPYVIENYLIVGSATGTTLKIQEGCQLLFKLDAYMQTGGTDIYGAIEAEGSSSDPVVFSSAAANSSKGDWEGIWFYNGTMNNTSFDYCIFSYGGGYSETSGNLTIAEDVGNNISISNSTISYSDAWGIYRYEGLTGTPSLTNIVYSGNDAGNKNF